MSDQISFKCRVRGVAINCANQYYEYYVKNSYLLFSQAFIKKPYYVIEAEATNYLHLVGVSTSLSAACFFDKCLDGTLSEEDFGLSFHREDPKHSKGSIRQKILTLPSMFSCLTENALVEEGFEKNLVRCKTSAPWAR